MKEEGRVASSVSSAASQTIPRKYTDAEIERRRELGLCFKCDEKFRPGHRCKKQLQVLILFEEVEEPTRPPDVGERPMEGDGLAELFLNSFLSSGEFFAQLLYLHCKVGVVRLMVADYVLQCCNLLVRVLCSALYTAKRDVCRMTGDRDYRRFVIHRDYAGQLV